MVLRPLLASCALLAAIALPAHALQAPCATEVVHEDLTLTLDGPRLRSPDGAAVVGGPISFQVVEGRPNEFGILFYGPEAPFVDPALIDVLVPGPPYTILSFFTDAEGRSPVQLAAPELDPILCGERVAIQGAVLDPAAPGGVALTNSIRIHVGEVKRPLFPMPAYVHPSDLLLREYALAVGDFDGDGLADIAVASELTDTIYVLDGDAQRELAWRSVAAGNGALNLRALDLTGDQILDLVYMRQDTTTDQVFVGVRPGIGDGSFGVAIETHVLTSGFTASGLRLLEWSAFGDFDADGNPDLVMANTDYVLYPGRGDGTFDPGVVLGPVLISVASRDLKAPDLDDDGDLDLVRLSTSRIEITLGNGDGTFDATELLTLPPFFVDFHLGDFDGDGTLDLSNMRHFVAGNGDGTFAPPQELGESSPVFESTLVTDADRDGVDDLVGNGGNVFSITEGAVLALPTGLVHAYMVTGDVDGDGYEDSVFTKADPREVVVAYGNEYGIRSSRYVPSLATNPDQILLEDVNGDGHLDAIVVNRGAGLHNSGAINVHRGAHDGALGGPEPLVFGVNPGCVAAGDIDGDGDRDLAIFFDADPMYRTLLTSDGAGGYGSARYEPGWEVGEAELADMDGDGALDVVATFFGDEVRVARGDGNGDFVTVGDADSYLVGEGPEIWIADLNGDGMLDLATANDTAENLTTLLSDPGSGFVPGTPVPLGPVPRDLTGADFDADGNLDLAVRFESVTGGGAAIALGGGDGTFQAPSYVWSGGSVSALDVADFDGNGVLDLAFFPSSGSRVGILSGRGDGTFASPAWIGAESSRELAAGDLDGDGIPDLVSSLVSMNMYQFPLGTQGIEVSFNLLGERDAPQPCVIRPRAGASAGTPKTFDGTRSGDVGAAIVDYHWEFGDGAADGGPTPTHVFLSHGEYVVRLLTTDSTGATHVCSFVQVVGPAQPGLTCGLGVTDLGSATLELDASAAFGGSTGETVGYSWDFGDGTTVTEPGPITTHQYGADGSYDVVLTIVPAVGESISCSTTVVVEAYPTCSFQHEVTQAFSVELDGSASAALAGSIVEYVWDFGDGAVASGPSPVVSHVFPDTGPYTVSLTVIDDGGLTATCEQEVDPLPLEFVCNFVATDLGTSGIELDASAAVWYGTGPITAYEWDFGDGTTSSGPSAVTTHQFPGNGAYAVELTVSGAGANPVTCSMTVTVQGRPTCSFLPDTDVLSVDCDGAGSMAATGTIVEYVWDFGDGTVLSSAASPLVSHAYAMPGTYTVTLTVIDSQGLQSTCGQTIAVFGPPSCSFVTGNFMGQTVLFSTSTGGGLTYFWDFGDGDTLATASKSVMHAYAPGTWVATLTVTDVNEVMLSCSQTIVVP